MFTLILLYFVPCSQIAKKLKIPIHIEITLKRNFTFDQVIDKNVHVPDNGHSARVIACFLTHDARCPGWVGNYARAGLREPRR